MSEPLLTLSQWKELQETNTRNDLCHRSQLNLFTAACEKVRIVTPHQLLQDSPQQASTTTSVSSDCAGVLAATETSLTSADKATKLPLPSGFTVPIEARPG